MNTLTDHARIEIRKLWKHGVSAREISAQLSIPVTQIQEEVTRLANEFKRTRDLTEEEKATVRVASKDERLADLLDRAAASKNVTTQRMGVRIKDMVNDLGKRVVKEEHEAALRAKIDAFSKLIEEARTELRKGKGKK